jgi:hypothetical protein
MRIPGSRKRPAACPGPRRPPEVRSEFRNKTTKTWVRTENLGFCRRGSTWGDPKNTRFFFLVPLPPAREAELAEQRKKRRSDGGEYRAMVPLVGIVWMGKTGFEAIRTHSPLYSSSIYPSQQDSLLYTQFFRTHPSSIPSSIHSIYCGTHLSL